MKTSTKIVNYLEHEEARKLIAIALGISVENVVKTKYGYAIENVPENEIAEKLKKAICDES